jgi:hypothetical protein
MVAKQWILFACTDDDNRNNRVRILQEYVYTNVTMPDTLWNEEHNAIESIVFAHNKTRLSVRCKRWQYATIDNRKKSRAHKQVIRWAYLKELLEQELMWRNNFPRAVRILQEHIIYNKEKLYTQFPLEATSVKI